MLQLKQICSPERSIIDILIVCSNFTAIKKNNNESDPKAYAKHFSTALSKDDSVAQLNSCRIDVVDYWLQVARLQQISKLDANTSTQLSCRHKKFQELVLPLDLSLSPTADKDWVYQLKFDTENKISNVIVKFLTGVHIWTRKVAVL